MFPGFGPEGVFDFGGIPFEREHCSTCRATDSISAKSDIRPISCPASSRQSWIVLFDTVQQKLTDQWITRTSVWSAGDHLLTGLLFDSLLCVTAKSRIVYPRSGS
jgi:hypothetical protein